MTMLTLSSVDNLLQGGVFTSELTELWGSAASGKTQVRKSGMYHHYPCVCTIQLCMCLAGQVVKSSPYSVCYVDGNAGGFNSSQLQQYLRHQSGGMEEEDVLSTMMGRVHVFRVFSVFELLSLLQSTHYHISHQVRIEEYDTDP